LRASAAHTLQTAGDQLYDEISKDDPFKTPPSEVTVFLAQRQNLLKDVPTETHNRVKAAIQAGLDAGDSRDQIAARINQVFDGEAAGRSVTIAQTEVNAAYGAGRQLAMKTAGITHKQWLSSGNTNVRPSHRSANGQTVPIASQYLVGGYLLDHPGDSKAPPHETINCHCVSIPVEDPTTQN